MADEPRVAEGARFVIAERLWFERRLHVITLALSMSLSGRRDDWSFSRRDSTCSRSA